MKKTTIKNLRGITCTKRSFFSSCAVQSSLSLYLSHTPIFFFPFFLFFYFFFSIFSHLFEMCQLFNCNPFTVTNRINGGFYFWNMNSAYFLCDSCAKMKPCKRRSKCTPPISMGNSKWAPYFS